MSAASRAMNSIGSMGQGALVLREPRALANPFFCLVSPGLATYALVVLAALATTIASQALISGVFSLTHQAVQLGYFPRVTIHHTSREAEGQIYVPLMNWGLLLACIALVVGFKESARLASAYGIAVSGTMAITSIVFFDVTRKTWKWSPIRSVSLLLLFLSFDLPFFGANLVKFVDGGYIPVVVGVAFFVIMVDWRVGREALVEYIASRTRPLADFVHDLGSTVARVPGLAVYLSPNAGVPPMLQLQVRRMRSLAERVVLLNVIVEHVSQVDEGQRFQVEKLDQGVVRIALHFGYMENPEAPPALERALRDAEVDVALADATYYVGRETFLAGSGGKLKPLPEALFAFLSRNAKSAAYHFGLPPEQVVELGTVIDL